MTALVEAHDVTLRYGKGRSPAVAGVSIAVEPGASVGIVGESGSGKSSLARMLAGVVKPTSGTVVAMGKEWGRIRRTDPIRRSVQMIFQDPSAALNPWMSARDAVAEVVQHWDGASTAQAQDRAEGLLAETGLTRAAMTRRPRELSGGQCQRVGIARALACSPALIIADEPTSALDGSVQAQILNTLLDLRESRNLALLLISHDLAVVRYMTDTAMVMNGGYIVEQGDTEQVFTNPAHPYTQELVGAVSLKESQPRCTSQQ